MKSNRIKKIIAVFLAFFCLSMIKSSKIQPNSAHADYVEGKAECVIEAKSRRVLYQKNGDLRLPMASTTKIVTCATVLKLCKNLQETVIIPKEAVGIEGSSVYLQCGQKFTVEDLLYGLMLRSGNDCATALALYCSPSIADFCAQMNRLAQEAGALNSRFENPHGLPCNNHYTTAYDLSLITAYAMQNPTFCEIVSTKFYKKCGWQNKNKMLSLYEDGIGVKTGYTKQAGRCLVSAGKRKNMTVICTLLNCSTTYERSIKLLDDAFNSYSLEEVVKKGQIFSLQTEQGEISAVSIESFYYPVLEEERRLFEIKTQSYTKALKRRKGKICVGKFSIYLSKQLIFSGNLYKL